MCDLTVIKKIIDGGVTTYKLSDSRTVTLDELLVLSKNGRLKGVTVVNKDGKIFVRGMVGNKIIVEKQSDRIEIYRDIYDVLNDWKTNSKQPFLLIGTDGVGKTHVIERFTRKHFKRVVYINLASDMDNYIYTTAFEKHMAKIDGKQDHACNLELKALFSETSMDFEDISKCVIVIDNIHESKYIYSKIGVIAKSLESRLIVIANCKLKYDLNFCVKYDDLYEYQLETVSFDEYLKSVKSKTSVTLYNDLWKIKNYSRDKFTTDELCSYVLVEKEFKDYIRIGGYPKIIQEYTRNNSIYDAELRLSMLCNKLHAKLSDYLESSDTHLNFVSDFLFDAVLKHIVLCMHYGLNIDNLIDKTVVCVEDSITACETDKVTELPDISGYLNKNLLKQDLDDILDWLVLNNVVGKRTALRYSSDDVADTYTKYFFKDMGILWCVLCTLSLKGVDSDKNRVITDNFLYIYLDRKYKKDFDLKSFYRENEVGEDIGFILNDTVMLTVKDDYNAELSCIKQDSRVMTVPVFMVVAIDEYITTNIVDW
jgi:hypothetical protein